MSLEIGGFFAGIPLADWVAFLGVVALKGTLLVALTFAGVRLFHCASARWHSRIWTATFGALLILPVQSGLPLLLDGTNLTERLEAPGEFDPALRIVRPRAPIVDAAGTVAADPGPAPIPHGAVSGPALLPLFWFAGVLLLTLRSMRALWNGRRAARTARRVSDPALTALVARECAEAGLASGVELRSRTDSEVPFVWSALRRIVVLPNKLTTWSPAELRPLLLHELAHVRRHDLVRLVMIELAKSMHWFNPLVYAAARRARLAMEMDCDETACRGEGVAQAKHYSRLLLWFARGAGKGTLCAPAMARRGEIEERLLNLLQPHRAAPHRWLAAAALPVVGVLLLLPLVSTQVAAGQPDAPRDAIPLDAALSEAIGAGDTVRVLELVEHDPDQLEARDMRGMTSLALAAWNGQGALVEVLAERGALLDQCNGNGLTPLFCAMDRSRWASPDYS